MFTWEDGPLTLKNAIGYELSGPDGKRVFALHFIDGRLGYQALLEIPGDMVERVYPEAEELLRGLSMTSR
jgi:hypothetical protein